MENTGIAAAGEAGIGGKAGIVGTDRDGGAGGGRDGECGVGSGREEAERDVVYGSCEEVASKYITTRRVEG